MIHRRIKNLKKCLLAIFVVISGICLQGWKGMDKYDWFPTESALKQYPMKIVRGDLILSDGTSIYIPDGKVFNNGWGNFGSTHITGEQFKLLPAKLEILWFSFVEDKFYLGSFDLPIAQLEQAFKQGFINPHNGEKSTYDSIITGLAPKGNISVWIAGAGIVQELVRFQAQAIELDQAIIDKVLPGDRKTYIQTVLESYLDRNTLNIISEHGLTSTLWQRYAEQFLWQPRVTGVNYSTMWLFMNNGEKEFMNASGIMQMREHRATPKEIRIEWGKPSERYMADIKFNEAEIFAVFDELCKDNAKKPLKLWFDINPNLYSVSIYLQDSQSSLKLEKAEAKVYRL